MFIVTVKWDGLAVTIRKQISLPVTGASPLTGPVRYRSKTTLTGYRALTAYRAWIQDPEVWIQDPGSRTLDPGSRTLDPGSRILDPGSRILDPGTERNGKLGTDKNLARNGTERNETPLDFARNRFLKSVCTISRVCESWVSKPHPAGFFPNENCMFGNFEHGHR